MRLFEAMIDANHRAVAGDTQAGLHPAEFASELPLVALTCIDTRLNALLPEVLGVPGDEFIWLRNAGNIITSPLSSTMRSLALACAVKGGKEIAIIGHTDCQVAKTGTLQLLDKLSALGVERHLLPENVNEYFGIFSNERENIIKGVALVRSSPLIGPKIPVHGLLVDITTGKVDWLVNGYETLGQNLVAGVQQVARSTGQAFDALKSIADFKIADLKFPESKIGELATTTQQWLVSHTYQPPALATAPEPAPGTPPPQSNPPLPPKIPLPPPIRPRLNVRRNS
jgi:carbonic anhydrase